MCRSSSPMRCTIGVVLFRGYEIVDPFENQNGEGAKKWDLTAGLISTINTVLTFLFCFWYDLLFKQCNKNLYW